MREIPGLRDTPLCSVGMSALKRVMVEFSSRKSFSYPSKIALMAARVRCVGWASDGPRSHKAQLKKHKTPSYGGLLSGDTTRKSACLQRSRCWGRLRGPPKNRRIDAPRPRWWAASATLGVRDTRPVRAWTACPPACGDNRAGVQVFLLVSFFLPRPSQHTACGVLPERLRWTASPPGCPSPGLGRSFPRGWRAL